MAMIKKLLKSLLRIVILVIVLGFVVGTGCINTIMFHPEFARDGYDEKSPGFVDIGTNGVRIAEMSLLQEAHELLVVTKLPFSAHNSGESFKERSQIGVWIGKLLLKFIRHTGHFEMTEALTNHDLIRRHRKIRLHL